MPTKMHQGSLHVSNNLVHSSQKPDLAADNEMRYRGKGSDAYRCFVQCSVHNTKRNRADIMKHGPYPPDTYPLAAP